MGLAGAIKARKARVGYEERVPRRCPRLPVTEKLKGEVLTLPMFPGMTEPEVNAVASAIQTFYGKEL